MTFQDAKKYNKIGVFFEAVLFITFLWLAVDNVFISIEPFITSHIIAFTTVFCDHSSFSLALSLSLSRCDSPTVYMPSSSFTKVIEPFYHFFCWFSIWQRKILLV